MIHQMRPLILVFAACMYLGGAVIAAGYDDMRGAAVTRCRAIDPEQYQSGLAFNPDGYRSYYVRSECLQRTAVLFRDEPLCSEVKQRRTILWSSWGYSPERCRDLVKEGLDADRKTLEEMKRRYMQGGVMLRDFRVERNGNGRDFDIIPVFTGEYGHGYVLTFEILDMTAPAPIVFYSSGHYVDATSRMSLYVRQSDLRARFPALTLNRSYVVRATATLDIGYGGPSGYWSAQFIDRVFPVRERTQSITKTVTL